MKNTQVLPTLVIGAATVAALGLGYAAFQTLERRQVGATQPLAPPDLNTPDQLDPEPVVQNPTDRPRIDVVFALDTTGSMGGMLEGAKQKIWSIADRIVSGDPRPDVRFGLVAYRDRGDAYVTRITPLSRDLDEVHQELLGLQPAGGGDGPEDVNAALAAALDQQPWDSGEKVLKLVFLVGDAPPHDDYDGEKSWQLAARANQSGIMVNTLRCGPDHQTAAAWEKIARASGGQFDTIAQNGGVIARATPYDAELGALNRELADTVVGYGSSAVRAKSRRKMAARSSLSSVLGASAAAYNAKAGRMNEEDLLTQISDGKVSLDGLEEGSLPEELQKLSVSERNARIEGLQKKRSAVKKKILALSKKRDEHLKAAAKKDGKVSELDDRLVKTLRTQAAAIDVAY